MRIAEKCERAVAAADLWRGADPIMDAKAQWGHLLAALTGLGFYGIVRGPQPGQVIAWLDGVRFDL